MNLALLLPSALLALSALLLPLLVHLNRRSEQRPTDFAALRWISAQLRPRRKLVFQEILLLLLRLLLLIAIAFFLAKPVSMQTASPQHWVMLVPGANIDAAKNLPADKSAKWHWLSPGFPDYEDKPLTTNLNVGSLLRELDAQLPANTSLTLIVPEQISGLDGERIQLSRQVEWNIVPGSMPTTQVAKYRQPIRLAIRYDEAHSDATLYFRAAHSVWQADRKASEKDSLDAANISLAFKPDRNALVWLATGELPLEIRDWVNRGGTIIVSKETLVPEMKSGTSVWRNEQGKVLIIATPFGQGRILQWKQVLKPDAMPELLDVTFPSHLQALLQTAPAAATRALATSQIPLTGARAFPEAPASLQIWLALLTALLFMLERWLANAPRRWSTA
ncbi:MAG: BatA domain-containing protein [Arenimonas sp.]